MSDPKGVYFRKRADILVKNLRRRNFDAVYCENAAAACKIALEMIPKNATVAWGGSMTAKQIGLLDAIREGDYRVIDRSAAKTASEREQTERNAFFSDFFITSANAISIDGQMVNIDGYGNRAGAIVFGPKNVLVVAGMNKVTDSLEQALDRARYIAAPSNQQRFQGNTPCTVTGCCGDCTSEDCICNQIVITRNCRPNGRIKFILIGEELGL